MQSISLSLSLFNKHQGLDIHEAAIHWQEIGRMPAIHTQEILSLASTSIKA
jgi:hypothetical protein